MFFKICTFYTISYCIEFKIIWDTSHLVLTAPPIMVNFRFFFTLVKIKSCKIFFVWSFIFPFLLFFRQSITASATAFPGPVLICLSNNVYMLSKTLSKNFCFTVAQTQSIVWSGLQWSPSTKHSLSFKHLGQSVHRLLTSPVSTHWWHLIQRTLNSAISLSIVLISSIKDSCLFVHFSLHWSHVCLSISISNSSASFWNKALLNTYNFSLIIQTKSCGL